MFRSHVWIRSVSFRVVSCSTIIALASATAQSSFCTESQKEQESFLQVDEEYFLGSFLNIDKQVQKLLKPIYKLNSNMSSNRIAKEAAKFKFKMDSIYGTGLSVDDVSEMAIAELEKNGIHVNRKTLKPFLEKIKKCESKMNKKKLPFFQNEMEASRFYSMDAIDDAFFALPAEAQICFVYVFCGAILCAIPTGVTQGVGVGLISGGVVQFFNVVAKESEKK